MTASPALTFTAVTVPEEVKLRSSVCAAATVPSAETVVLIDPVETVTSCLVAAVDDVEEPVERTPNHQTPAAMIATTTTIAAIPQRVRSRLIKDRFGRSTSEVVGGSAGPSSSVVGASGSKIETGDSGAHRISSIGGAPLEKRRDGSARNFRARCMPEILAIESPNLMATACEVACKLQDAIRRPNFTAIS